MTKKTMILSIDDDEEICFALNALFQLNGWDAYSAQSVETGLALFKAYRPDIVLIDYHMPRTNGVEGVHLLRKLDRNVPIIVFTIDESQEVADAFLEAGANDFALKPIKTPDLVSRINLHLRLIEQRPQRDLNKGMSQSTLDLITGFLSCQSNYLTANKIAEGTGLAYQTIFRYLQHLVHRKEIEQLSIYGKVGRPKQVYRIIKPEQIEKKDRKERK